MVGTPSNSGVCMTTDRRNSPACLVSGQYGALLIGTFITVMAPATHAETRLMGQVDAIRIEVRDASLEEVFDALGASYGLRFRSVTPLGGRFSGTFEGPLLQVVARMLDRYDYIVKKTDSVIDIAVLGAHGTVASPTNIPPARIKPVEAAAPPSPAPSIRKPAAAGASAAPLDWELRTNVTGPAQQSK
jgi:hypothetical protein